MGPLIGVIVQRYFILFGFIFMAAMAWYLASQPQPQDNVVAETKAPTPTPAPTTQRNQAPKPKPQRAALPAPKQGFDYYILALSWMPGFCALADDDREREQCARTQHDGFAVHGLWPNYDDGTWPEFCDAETRNFRRQANQLKDIMASESLAAYQWRKHGTCSDDLPKDYAKRVRAAWDKLNLPTFDPNQQDRIRTNQLISAFVKQNKALDTQELFATCRRGQLVEVRVCFDKQLNPTKCGLAAQKSCRSANLNLY